MNGDLAIRIMLRGVGSVAALAAFCVALPYAWMNGVHQWLGMGTLPTAPIVGYLARSTSAFYALLGGLLWVVSLDLPRYRPLLRPIGAGILLLGAVLLVVDHVEGLPSWWQAGEGPFDMLCGALLLFLNANTRMRSENAAAPRADR